MKRSHHPGCFLIVEGRDDRLFFEQFVDSGDCAVQVADGESNVVEVIDILDADSFPGAVGVIDADLDRLEGYSWQSSNLIVLDTYDLEALLIKSRALERVLVELGSSEKITGRAKHPREELIDAAVPIGCLRLYSRRSKLLNLKFDGMQYERFVDRGSLRTNVRNMVREVKNRSQRSDLACDDTAREIRSIEDTVNDPWLVCCGTDMVAILGIGLRKALGTNDAGAVKPDVLRTYLRLAYEWQELIDSRLGRDLREWSERNPGFRVLNETQRAVTRPGH